MVFISHDIMFIIKYLCLISLTFLCCGPLFKLFLNIHFGGRAGLARVKKEKECFAEHRFCLIGILGFHKVY